MKEIFVETFEKLPGTLPEDFFVIFYGNPPSDEYLSTIHKHVCRENLWIKRYMSPGKWYSLLDEYSSNIKCILIVSYDTEFFLKTLNEQIPGYDFFPLSEYPYMYIPELQRLHPKTRLCAIWSQLPNGGIGINKPHTGMDGELILRFKDDMDHFKTMTDCRVVIMGSSTFKSMNCIPLKGRVNIVVTHFIFQFADCEIKHFRNGRGNTTKNLWFVNSVEAALHLAYRLADIMNTESIWVIGGAAIYDQMFKYISEFYITMLNASIGSIGDYEGRKIPSRILTKLHIASDVGYNYSGPAYIKGYLQDVKNLEYHLLYCRKEDEPIRPVYPYTGFTNKVPLII